MIPDRIGYLRPRTADEAVGLLGPGRRVLCGGHSLVPALKLRRTPATTLVDVSRLAELRTIVADGPDLVVGAAVTYHEMAADPLVRRHLPVLARLGGRVADPQVRHRGTPAGALGNADPAGDFPAVALALGARLAVRSAAGEREIGIDDLFTGRGRTSLRPGDLITAIRLPRLGPGWAAWYEKFTRVTHMWAVAGACALVHRDGERIVAARIGLAAMADTPARATATERAVADGASPADAAALAADGTDPATDVHATAEYRQHVARVITRRALVRATEAAV